MMTDNRSDAILTSLKHLLGQETDALKAGDIEKLPTLGSEKELLLEAILNERPADLTILAEVKDKIYENQKLLESAMEGIRFAANRLQTLRETRKKLEFYDQYGAKSKIRMNHTPEFEKRA